MMLKDREFYSNIVRPIINYVENHINGWPDIKDITKNFQISESDLNEILEREMKLTLHELIENSQLNFAHKLIIETNLSLNEVALACNFNDFQYFEKIYKKRFNHFSNKSLQKESSKKNVILSIAYLKPYDFDWLIQCYQSHQMGNLEWFEDNKMFRVVNFEDSVGIISIANDSKNSCLQLNIDFSNVRYFKNIFNRVKKMFDVDADPVALEKILKTNPQIHYIFKKYSGIRIASSWDPFEISIATILGQLVSVERGRALVHDLIELLGESTMIHSSGKIIKKFPSSEIIVSADLSSLKTTRIRKKTLIEFSKAYLNKEIHFDTNQEIELFTEKLLKIFGIGIWTANYISLKGLKYLDAFPDSDLLLARAIKLFPKELFDLFQPIRGYVAMLLWREYAVVSKKNKFL